MVFQTVNDYEDALFQLNQVGVKEFDELEAELGFTSMRSFYLAEDDYSNIPIKDDLFTTILNPDAQIKIAGKVYEIDLLNEEVHIISADVTNKEKSSEKTTFSFNENVLYPEEPSLKGTYCDGFKAYTRYSTYNGKVETVLHYMKFGIYYRLKAEIKRNYQDNSSMSIELNNTVTWKNKKESGSSAAGSIREGTSKDIVFAFYSGTRRLKEWNAQNVDFFWEDFVNESWVTRNIYKSGHCD